MSGGVKNIYIYSYKVLIVSILTKYVFVALHRQREKEHRQKLVELREQEKTDIRTEEDLFKRLDELELEEELEDEIFRLVVSTIKTFINSYNCN